MARPRSEVTIAMLEVFGGQSEPMTWRTVAEELARRGVIGAALAPGDLRLLHRAVGEAYRRGELVNVGVARGIPGQTRPPCCIGCARRATHRASGARNENCKRGP